jgi:hypothetical protein
MRGCNVSLHVGSSSRYPALVSCLLDVAQCPDADKLLPRIIERAADIRDFVTEPEKFAAVIDYLNKFLRLDGLELQRRGDASARYARTRVTLTVEREALGELTRGSRGWPFTRLAQSHFSSLKLGNINSRLRR